MKQIDPKRINELTVISVSLQTGRMRLTVSDNKAITEGEAEPESIIDFVLGSASIPVVVEPRKVRFWVQAQMIRQDEDKALMISRNLGMLDPNCKIRVDKELTVRCVFMKTKVSTTSDDNIQWTTLLQIPDAAEREKLWTRAFKPLEGDASSDGSDQSQHFVLKHGKWTRVRPTLIEFSTLHQLVDGGVTDFLFVNDLAKMRRDGIADTVFILTTGENIQKPTNNQEYEGGVNIGLVAFEHLWESHEFATLETQVQGAGYTTLLADMTTWIHRALKWRTDIMKSNEGKERLGKLESKINNQFPDGSPGIDSPDNTTYPDVLKPYPEIFLLMPDLRIFDGPFDAKPENTKKALEHGCELAAGIFDSPMDVPGVYRATPTKWAPRCEELSR